MLPVAPNEDYRERYRFARQHLLTEPDLARNRPLRIADREFLKELSFCFFLGWLFGGVLNRKGSSYSLTLVPYGPESRSSLLVLHKAGSVLIPPRSPRGEALDPRFFGCPLDRIREKDGLPTPTQSRLCPVVNRLRYNLSQARPDGDVSDLREPRQTRECCKSRKSELWNYLDDTLLAAPEQYGALVGGAVFPLRIPFEIAEPFLKGSTDKTDFSKLFEETLLWFAVERAGVEMGFPHAIFTQPFESNEIDFVLYSTAGRNKDLKEPPEGGWSTHVSEQALCLFELTLGHRSEQSASGRGLDSPKNKLMNFHALRSIGFRSVVCHYLTLAGEPDLAASTHRALEHTDGFEYEVLSEHFDTVPDGSDVETRIAGHLEDPIPLAELRTWFETILGIVLSAAERFRDDLAEARENA